MEIGVIGREEEIKQLKRAYNSNKSEFVAVYGRRRVGKTFLVRETFDNIGFAFQYAGIHDVSNQNQLEEFYKSMISYGLPKTVNTPATWFEAFHLLEDVIVSSPHKRKIIFIDELPWMDSPNSNFVPAFEHFWNGWASARKDVLLIICGSATSWMLNKVIRNKGGLHNRVTYNIRLQQFSLSECEEFVKSNSLPFNRDMILQGYMVMGGVPFYWSCLDPSKTISQNIENLFLRESGTLRNEFDNLYSCIFNKPEKYLKVVEVLSSKKSGMTREEIIEVGKGTVEDNGQLSTILEDLIECGFVRKYWHLSYKVRGVVYQLIDCYTLFYYKFVKRSHNFDEKYWEKLQLTPTYSIWCGLAFERVCLLHSRQIKAALGISGIIANIFAWHIKSNKAPGGVQIDLLIDRSDNVINVCEMKYAPRGYSMKKSEFDKMNTRLNVLQQHVPSNKFVSPVLVTSNDIIDNDYSKSIQLRVTANQLFT